METKYKFVSQLSHYRFDQTLQTGSRPIDWFILASDAEAPVDRIVRAFTYEEMTMFQRFTVSNPTNFDGAKQYRVSSDEEALYGALSDIGPGHPQCVTLRKVPKVNFNADVTASDIILCDRNGRARHDYDLPFDVIGRVQNVSKEPAQSEA